MFRSQPVKAKDLPLFAQCTIPALDQREGLSGKSILSTVAMVGLPLAFAGALLTLARPDKAQNRPAANAAHAAIVADSAAPAADATTVNSDENRRPLTFYTQEVRTNLFSEPLPPPPPPVIQPKPVEQPKPVPVKVMPVDPFADWSYTGTVKTETEIMALIENTKTREGQYVKVGDTFQGAQVTDVTDQMVTLTLGGKPSKLAKSDNVVLTPLDKTATNQAAPAATDNQQPQPGMPATINMQFGPGAWRRFNRGNGGGFGGGMNPGRMMRMMQGGFGGGRRFGGGGGGFGG